MEFKPIASSSRGNCYLLTSDGAAPLLLEAGIPIQKIREALRAFGLSLSDIAATLVSHEHGDHSKAVKDLLKASVDCYMTPGTAFKLGIQGHHRLKEVVDPFVVEGWAIKPFPLEHDAEAPAGFFIAHGQDRLLFIPDTVYVENRFEGATLIAVECNNIAEIMSQNIQEGNIPAVVGKRVRRNHMNLENLIAMLRANDLSRCRQIYLMHLSDGNSDEARMKREVQAATGIPTECCQ